MFSRRLIHLTSPLYIFLVCLPPDRQCSPCVTVHWGGIAANLLKDINQENSSHGEDNEIKDQTSLLKIYIYSV